MDSLVVLSLLIERGVAIMAALDKVKTLVNEKQAAGESITLDDLKTLQLDDDAARDELVRAIEEAESGG